MTVKLNKIFRENKRNLNKENNTVCLQDSHLPVLLKETVELLCQNKDGFYLDLTLGRGGHSIEILNFLSDKGRLISVDKDIEAINFAKRNFKDSRLGLLHDTFSNVEKIGNDLGMFGKVNGILVDLGMSSPQLNNDKRGFSFMYPEAFLDMRYDNSKGITASDWLNTATEKEIFEAFKIYGEERKAKFIASKIIESRLIKPVLIVSDLIQIVKKISNNDFTSRKILLNIFRAIRIVINQEIEELSIFLNKIGGILAPKGRLVIISFHSTEDRIIKSFFKNSNTFKSIGKFIKPSFDEIVNNPRSRSAILRTYEKLI